MICVEPWEAPVRAALIRAQNEAIMSHYAARWRRPGIVYPGPQQEPCALGAELCDWCEVELVRSAPTSLSERVGDKCKNCGAPA